MGLSADFQEASRARQLLARHPVAVDVARAAASLLSCDVDVVVFEEQRSFLVASAQYNMLQPRAQLSAERLLQSSDLGHAISEGAAAFAITGTGGVVVGSLTLIGGSVDAHVDGLHALARAVSALLSAELSPDHAAVDTAILQGLRDAVVVVDTDLVVRWANNAVGSLIGRTPAEIVGRSAAELLHPDDLNEALDAVIRLSSGLEAYRAVVRLSHADGSYERVEVTGADHSDDPAVAGMVLSLRNADAANELEQRLNRTSLMAKAIVAELHDGIVATDAFGAITLVNKVARELFAFDAAAPASSFALSDLALLDKDGRPIPNVPGALAQLDDSSASEPTEMCVVSRTKGLRYVTARRRRVSDDDGTTLGTVLAFHDQTEARRTATELENHALHDQLTGLANRRQLHERLGKLAGATDRGLAAVCFVDLDGFKLVNDTHGHPTGDQLVRIAAERLSRQLRGTDLLVRHGGDEFIALLVDLDSPETAMQIAERLRSCLAQPYVVDGDTRFDLTASVGVAIADLGALDDELLLRQADIALYAAKSRGRNRVEQFDVDLAVATEVEERQRRMLRTALERDGLVMHFQPLVDSSTGATIAYEALARCPDEDGNLVGPSAFLEAVSSSGLVWELDQRAFDLSCQAAAVLADIAAAEGDEPPLIASNFSALSIMQPAFVRVVTETVRSHGVAPRSICIEITESAAFDAGATGIAVIQALHDAGFLVALDDFGTGYSSLAHLRDLPLDSVKVDRTFISKLSERTSERAIAEAIVSLAGDLGLGVVAEGVESSEQLSAAQDLGFNIIQGWHYSPALALDEVLSDWLARDVANE